MSEDGPAYEISPAAFMTVEDPAVRVFCDERHMNHRIKPERIDFEGTEKIRFNCRHCHRNYQRLLTKWEKTQATLRAAGITSINLRHLERYG